MKPSLTSQNITRSGVTPPQAAVGCACLVWVLVWLLASAGAWPPHIVGSGLLATALVAGWIAFRPICRL